MTSPVTERERNAITSHLLAYGDENGFRPLAARGYGSRARGLESQQSDYDVFFVFAQPPATYAVGADTETYTKEISPTESELNTEIELHGWDLKRFIGGDGLAGSNPTAIEFTAADGTEYYRPNTRWDPQLRNLCDHAYNEFKPYALINHYRSMAAGNYGKYIEQSWVHEWSMAQFAEYAGTQAGQTSIDTDRGVLTIGILGYDEHTVEIPLDEARAEGMIRRTTRDSTTKRHLNVAQALVKARVIEETHQMPTMNFPQLLWDIESEEWLPEHVFQNMLQLVAEKQDGHGAETIESADTPLHEWIEAELDREIDPEPHVQRTPDTGFLREQARTLYNKLSWSEVDN